MHGSEHDIDHRCTHSNAPLTIVLAMVICEMRVTTCRIRDDDRLDTLLSHLRKKTPSSPSPAKEGPEGEGGSVKGQLAVGLRDVRSRVAGLEDRLSARKKAAAVEAKR